MSEEITSNASESTETVVVSEVQHGLKAKAGFPRRSTVETKMIG